MSIFNAGKYLSVNLPTCLCQGKFSSKFCGILQNEKHVRRQNIFDVMEKSTRGK